MRSLFAPMLLCALLAASPSSGEVVRDYGYPFGDPLEATVIGTPAEYQADLPAKIPMRDARAPRAAGPRDSRRLLVRGQLCAIRSRRSRGRAPLAFIIPGTGASFDSSKSLILQRALYQAGLHVVSLPSPLHPNFIVAASPSRRPGLLTRGRPGHLPGDGADPPPSRGRDRDHRLRPRRLQPGRDGSGVRRRAGRRAALVRLRSGAADQPAGQPLSIRAGSRSACSSSIFPRSPPSTPCSTS